MKKKLINIYWFKRDLRLEDNEPLHEASKQSEKLLLIYFLEDKLISDPHYSNFHWNFVKQSIEDINLSLGKKSILFLNCDPIEGFKKISQKYKIKSIYSHMETGIELTYLRDIDVKKYCDSNSIHWFEYEKNYVKRGLKNRKSWIKGWNEYVKSPVLKIDIKNLNILDIKHLSKIFNVLDTRTNKKKHLQPGGTSNGLKYLRSFLEVRNKSYNQNISKPLESRSSCSRLSPYLSWGNLSSRYVWQQAYESIKKGNSPFQIRSFLSRLRWNSHFIQRFEMEHSIEFESVNRGYNDLRKKKVKKYYDSWENGKTGYPLVDASIVCLKTTGYLNFRMRSMIVSFLTHHLWQPWQSATFFLAQNFLDFEPGIHYSQLQMQAGETGVNTIRIYNPTKNAIEKDKEAVFIKKWLPKLKEVPIPLIYEPWKMSEIEQSLFNCKIGKDYPKPIVDISQTRKFALEKLWSIRKIKKVKEEKKRILKKHINT